MKCQNVTQTSGRMVWNLFSLFEINQSYNQLCVGRKWKDSLFLLYEHKVDLEEAEARHRVTLINVGKHLK